MKDRKFLEDNGVDVQKALDLFGDMETYNETLKTFLTDVPEKLKKIEEYKGNADMSNYAIYVHSLKSDAKYFGFMKLADLAYQHEMESKANNFYYVTENYDNLINEAKRVINIAKSYMGEEVVVEETNDKPKDKSILVVDDSSIIVNFVSKIFSKDYNVLTATDGEQALNIIKTNNNLACMLLDLNMPNVNGFAVLDYMNTNNLFKSIPVSIITGEGSKEAIDKAFLYPIVDVLMKPFNENNVELIVNKTISTKY